MSKGYATCFSTNLYYGTLKLISNQISIAYFVQKLQSKWIQNR